ncbi:MAG: hypothetical protein HY525_03345 [Betaproteobacteria bacterium]|nr:hypothetical protein [Betaproteobacteria bacterium]
MDNEHPDAPDIDALLAEMAPPSIPEQGFGPDNPDLFQVRGWNKIHAATVLAGLATVPDFHANDIRLDWLLRLILAKAEGHIKVQPAQLQRALNAGLSKAKVWRAEDPIEDLFCDRIATSRGNFQIIAGRWEAPGPYTQTLLSAFEALPAGGLKDRTLASVYALLSISDEIARRANLHRFTPSGGVEMGQLSVPSADSLKKISRRVVFTTDALSNLGINQEALAPFVLQQEHFSYVGAVPRGESPLELHPLIEHHNGIAVVSPTDLSLAVRAVMVNAAKRGGVEQLLLAELMYAQEKYAEISGFWNGPLSLPAPDAYFVRTAIVETGSGRYLQVIQVPPTFEYFPQRLFSAVAEIGAEVNQAIADHVMAFFNFLGGRSDYREATTLLLTSGWGAPHSLAPPIDDSRASRNWRFLALSFFEASVLGACDDGKLSDFLRINAQKERLETEGFSFENPNGPINLFGFWRDTRHNFIPEHMTDIAPPFGLMLPVDSLRQPHIEAARRKDLQALPFIDNTYRWVQRENWDDDDQLQPIYASLDDIVHHRLLGAVAIKERVWWLESLEVDGASREWRYRLWHAMLQWLDALGPQLIDRFPNSFPRGARCVGLSVPTETEFQGIGDFPADNAQLPQAVVVAPAQGNAAASVAVTGSWLAHVRRLENDAEVELVAAILEQLATTGTNGLSRDALRGIVKAAIGSEHWRWTHAGVALTPLDRMGAQGLLASFKAIRKSALALAKCGSIWRFHSRTDGVEIIGEAPCMEFLARYRASMLDALIERIRTFKRTELILLAAGRYQASRHEQSSWRRAIRAMRAIQGKAADQRAFERQNEMNAVQRAAKSIMEIAACEAQINGGVSPDQDDLDDLFATALLLLGNGQMFASIRAGLVEPRLKISPAGDLLGDRSLLEVAFRPGAEWKNSQTLDEADRSYGRDRTSPDVETRKQGLQLDAKLRAAIEAEYQISAEAFLELQYAVVAMASAARQEIIVMRRSELARALAADASFRREDPTPLLARLTLSSRKSWHDLSDGLKAIDFDLSRFDRPLSLIGRPLLALDDGADPAVLVAPLLISDSTMYSFSGLMDGSLQNQFWTSDVARRYVGEVSAAAGPRFEELIAEKLRGMGLRAWVRRKPSWALNQKVSQELGDIDVLAVSPDGRRVWVIEAKNLRLCRSEIEVASRLYDYRGRTMKDRKGKEVPDALLRHIRRVRYLRERNDALSHQLELETPPEVRGLLVVDSPQPMNFYMLEKMEDVESLFFSALHKFKF